MFGGVGGQYPQPMVRPGHHAYNQVEDVALFIDPVLAWRAWDIHEHPHRGLLLRSVTYHVHWPARKPMRAHCMSMLRRDGLGLRRDVLGHRHRDCPNVYHGCGIYSVKNQMQAEKWQGAWGGNKRIVGQVKLWGNIAVFTEGYLAEYAYPHSLVTPKDTTPQGMVLVERLAVERLAERYGCELLH